jgi:hypothetical protein
MEKVGYREVCPPDAYFFLLSIDFKSANGL